MLKPLVLRKRWLLAGCVLSLAFTAHAASPSAPAEAAVPTAPVIDRQPIGRVVTERGHVALSVLAHASTAISYQWRTNGVALADNGRVTGATTAVLNIDPVQLTDSGNYSVVATTGGASVTSAVAAVTVLQLPVGVTQLGTTGILVSVLGQIGDVYRVEESFDFGFSWRTNGYATNVTGVAQLVTGASGMSRFFRARFERMLPIVYPPSGQAGSIAAYGKLNQVWRLQSTADLQTWTDVRTATNSSGWVFFTDDSAPSARRLYRLAPALPAP